MRLAGTWKQYSKKAMPQLARITFQSASLRYFRCPYHAKVMKIFETVSRRIVRTVVESSFVEFNSCKACGKYRFSGIRSICGAARGKMAYTLRVRETRSGRVGGG